MHDKDEGEALLDLEWGHAAAPGAPLILYIGDEGVDQANALIDAFYLATQDNTCGTISVSFEWCDFNGYGYDAWDIVAMQADDQGQSVFVASGDFGSSGYTYDYSSGLCLTGGGLGVNEISADTYVTSVGGTQFYPSYAGINGVPLYGQAMGTDVGFGPEGVWDVLSGLGADASGGGKSIYLHQAQLSGRQHPTGRPARRAGRGIDGWSLGCESHCQIQRLLW